MKLHRIRGGTPEDLESRKYNICVGISLGNKWFTPDNIVELIQWSLRYSRENVLVCPADDIHAINLEVRGGRSREWAIKKAQKMSSELMRDVRARANEVLANKDRERVVYANWSDVVNDTYRERVAYLYDKYDTDTDFKREVQNIVRGYTSGEERVFSDDDINKFGTYILEELPEVSSRVPVKGIVCDAYVYPFDSELTVFIEKLQNGEAFPEIGKKIIETPKVFLEVR